MSNTSLFLLFSLSLACSFSNSAPAKIGESMEACDERYGARFVTETSGEFTIHEYTQPKFFVICAFCDDRCCALMLRSRSDIAWSAEEAPPIKDAWAKAIFRANGKGWAKTEEEDVWQSEDGLTAIREQNILLVREEGVSLRPELATPIRIDEDNLPDFLENTHKYQQHVVRLKLRVFDGSLSSNYLGKRSLRDYPGKVIGFAGNWDASNRFGIRIRMPEDPEKIPMANDLGLVTVTFHCSGSLEEGNEAISFR